MKKVIRKKGNAKVKKIANRKGKAAKGIVVPLAGLGSRVLARIAANATDRNQTTEQYVRWFLTDAFGVDEPTATWPETAQEAPYDPSENITPLSLIY